MTPRNFNAAELDEMQVDWQRTHNVKMVAELHGCTKRDVAEALGLSPAIHEQHRKTERIGPDGGSRHYEPR